jgi:hypothetical protein
MMIFVICYHADSIVHWEILPKGQIIHAMYYRDIMEQLLKIMEETSLASTEILVLAA